MAQSARTVGFSYSTHTRFKFGFFFERTNSQPYVIGKLLPILWEKDIVKLSLSCGTKIVTQALLGRSFLKPENASVLLEYRRWKSHDRSPTDRRRSSMSTDRGAAVFEDCYLDVTHIALGVAVEE